MVESRLAQSEAETDVIDAETASPITMTGLTPPGPASRKKKMLVAYGKPETRPLCVTGPMLSR